MKKIISALSFILFMGVVAISTQSCNSATTDNTTSEKETLAENQELVKVKAYYFHATRRCATCQAVEAVSKEAIKEYYGDKVTFESINRDEEKENPLMTKYKVNGQTLLIINGEKKVDLTNDAFLNARTNPDKFKRKLKSTIDSMM
ncbi:MAG: nitrophenyl compound nitroreductase subunit ArsF family protein [Dysgonamonadaceae bacterium]